MQLQQHLLLRLQLLLTVVAYLDDDIAALTYVTTGHCVLLHF